MPAYNPMPKPLSFHPPETAHLPPLSLDELRNRCSACSMHELCLPMGLGEADMDRLDAIIGRRRKIPKDTLLYRVGDTFTHPDSEDLAPGKTSNLATMPREG